VAWLKSLGMEKAHICLEAAGHYGRDLAVALHETGHLVSIVNPAQIRHFARTKLGRDKTDKVDATLIREYAEIFKPAPWSPPPTA
jgi:transposase